MAARERQRARLAGSGALCNGEMDGRLTRRQCVARGRARSRASWRPSALTGRGHDRVLRLARTIADLEGRAERARRATSTRLWATGSPRRRRWPRERRRGACAPACGGAIWSGPRAASRGHPRPARRGSGAGQGARGAGARRRRAGRAPSPGVGRAPGGASSRTSTPSRHGHGSSADGITAICRHSGRLPAAARGAHRRPGRAVRHRRAGRGFGCARPSGPSRWWAPGAALPTGSRWHTSSGGGSARRASPWSAGWRWGSTPPRIAAASTPAAPPSRFSPAAPTSPIRGAIAGSTTACAGRGRALRAAARNQAVPVGRFPPATGSWPA